MTGFAMDAPGLAQSQANYTSALSDLGTHAGNVGQFAPPIEWFGAHQNGWSQLGQWLGDLSDGLSQHVEQAKQAAQNWWNGSQQQRDADLQRRIQIMHITQQPDAPLPVEQGQLSPSQLDQQGAAPIIGLSGG